MIVHFNGELVPVEHARVSPLDRGFLFGDGVYEGLRAFDGVIIGLDLHIKRLRESLLETAIPYDASSMAAAAYDLLAARGLADAFIYWQVTRGEPGPGQPVRARVMTGPVKPTVFGYAVPAHTLDDYRTHIPTRSVITTRDSRWMRGLVKSISLLGNVLAAIEADEADAEDALLIRDGVIAEGTASNVVLALDDGSGGVELVTPSLESAPMLAGVTRAILLEHVPELRERPVCVSELSRLCEMMMVGTLSMVTSVTRLNGKPVGDGAPGPHARRMLDALVDALRADVRAGVSSHRSAAP